MRGDSLRDLYAKTIAVCGLGMLAVAGALVDYWPTGVVMPAVGPALATPQLASALPVPASALEAPALDVPVAPRDTRDVRRAGLRAGQDVRGAERQLGRSEIQDAQPFVAESASPRTFALDVTPASSVAYGEAVAVAEPAAPMLRAGVAYAALGQEIAFSAPESRTDDTLVAALHPAAPVASPSDTGNGFISGAADTFRKTGSTIANAGSKAGAAIIGGFRSMTGAMRRVNPFN